MKSNRKVVRWGTLAILVAVLSGCCVVPWGGRGYYGGGRYQGGHFQGGGYDGGGYRHG